MSRRSAALAMCGCAVVVVGCSVGRPKVVVHAWPAPGSSQPWRAIFATPAPVDVRSFATGHARTKLGALLNAEALRGAKLDPELPIHPPVVVAVIHHDVRGDYLVDAGLDASFRQSPHGNVHGLFAGMMDDMEQSPGEDLGARLLALHIRPRGLFFTHLHPDHTAGVPALADGLEYWFDPRETYPNYPVFFSGSHLARVPEMQGLDFSQAAEMAPLGRAIDVWGDTSVWAVSTPGHTAGHVSYVVNARTGPVLIVGDAAPTARALERRLPPARASDDRAALQSLDQLKAFVVAFPGVRIVFGHDDAQP